ncbi:MAG TPA: heat-inducible transcriptional repressor HrcA [bacterium]
MAPLNERERTVLALTVMHHIRSGEPIGSRYLAEQLDLDVSPATIRNTMADLEEKGYLRQTHVSSGRVPTDLGYRFYVDEVVGVRPARREGLEGMRERIASRRSEIGELIRETTRTLSAASRQAGLVLGPRLLDARLEHLELRRVASRRVLSIFVTESRLVQTRVLELPEDWPQEDLDAMARVWNERFAGLALREVRTRLAVMMAAERAALNSLVLRALELGRLALAAREPAEELYLDGAANILDVPEFADPGKARALVRAIEEKGRLCTLLDECLRADRVRVFIGGEVSLPGLTDVSLVTAPYRRDGEPIGVLGVIGPTRMAYERIIPIVACAADDLGDCLSRA